MTSRFHRGLLRLASLLVCAGERRDWLAEWRAESWYVAPARRTGFCLGAFRDAFWMRRHGPPAVPLQSPWECLGVLAVLAALSVFFALRLPLPREMFFTRALPDGLATVAGVSYDDFRLLPASSAFYGVAVVHERNLPVARASRNLFDLLQVPLATTDAGLAPAVVTRSAWGRYFGGDPHLVGKRLTIGGRPAQVMAVLSDRVWRLPGSQEAWVLVDDATLSAEPRGFVVSRMNAAGGAVSIHRADGSTGRFHTIPLTEPPMVWTFLFVMAVSTLVLPAVTDVTLGGHRPNWRQCLFLAAKIVLVVPIVLFGTADVLSFIAEAIQAHASFIGGVAAFRWILIDQRRRCPECLRVLTNPAPIGEPSRTVLEWYGTELVCSRGYGLLHVPAIHASYSQQRWLRLDSSWSGLFPSR